MQFNHIREHYAEDYSGNYADSPTFYPDRVNEAILTTLNVLDYIDEFNPWVLYPCYGFTLNEYEKNLAKMKFE